MSSRAQALAASARLRVAILAADPLRYAVLGLTLEAAGHEVVDSPQTADVVLSDGDCPLVDGRPVVVIGESDTEHAALLPRDADRNQIDAALRAASVGLFVRAPRTRGFQAMPEASLNTLLTPRELEVLNAIGEGLTNKSIARRLNISLHTVKFHAESLFRKLGVRTRAEAVAKAVERRHKGTVEL